MSKTRLNPNSTDYLTSFNRYNNYVKTTAPLDVITANFTPTSPINVSTYGDGKVYLSGSLTAAGSPVTNYPIGQLPDYLVPTNTAYATVVAVNSGGALVPNAVIISNESGVLATTSVINRGSYATMPSILITGPGSGAELQIEMGAISVTVATAQSGSGSYAPTNTVSLVSDGGGASAVVTVTTTKVVSATIAAGGTGGTNGTETVTGTTGTGTKFQASVTIAGGAITAILSITVAGDYTVNPTMITAEPVTGAGLTGATLDLKMGILAITLTTAGTYASLPADPVAQISTTGTGTGATFNVLWGLFFLYVNNGGSGYTSQSVISLTGGGSTGGAAVTFTLTGTVGQVSLLTSPTVGDMVSLDGVSFDVQPYY